MNLILNNFDWSSEKYEGLFEFKIPIKLLKNPLIEKDIWRTKEDLKLETPDHKKILTINFSQLEPSWLNLLAKLYILIRANLKISAKNIRNDVSNLQKFSIFLKSQQNQDIKYIDNELFEQFDSWIHLKGIQKNTISHYYRTLKKFFDTCRIEGWLDINTYWFIGRTTIHKTDKINYIPEEVWNQLEENLYQFPSPMQRKVLIIRTLGLRVGELLILPLDCLRKRGGQWRLRLKETEKFKIEDELPIPSSLAAIIKEQQGYIKKHFGDSYKQLFCSNNYAQNFNFVPVPRVMNIATFNNWLNRLANKSNICSKDGKLWRFRSHQFRRTVGTIFTNAGVRDLIIQKYLRHRNPDMQNHYQHLLKKVLGDEYQELIKEKNFVNIEGKVVATHKPQDAIQEYVRLRMQQITTQVGECHRSNLKELCPTINACWRCEDWRTSEQDLAYLKQDVERLKDEFERANKLGMLRQTKEIKKDMNHLEIRINALEEIVNND